MALHTKTNNVKITYPILLFEEFTTIQFDTTDSLIETFDLNLIYKLSV